MGPITKELYLLLKLLASVRTLEFLALKDAGTTNIKPLCFFFALSC